MADLRLHELALLPFGFIDLLLEVNLIPEVLLLKLLQLADSDQLFLVPVQSFAHGQLVMILVRLGIVVCVPELSLL